MISIFEKPFPIKDFSENDMEITTFSKYVTNESHWEQKWIEEKINEQKFFKSKFINDFQFESDNLSNVCIAVKVRAEIKKTPYDCTLTISLNNVILFFHIVIDKKKVKIIFSLYDSTETCEFVFHHQMIIILSNLE